MDVLHILGTVLVCIPRYSGTYMYICIFVKCSSTYELLLNVNDTKIHVGSAC